MRLWWLSRAPANVNYGGEGAGRAGRISATVLTNCCWATVGQDEGNRGRPRLLFTGSGRRGLAPAAGLAAVQPGAGGRHPRRPREDPQVEPQRGVLDVPEVELDPLVPGE